MRVCSALCLALCLGSALGGGVVTLDSYNFHQETKHGLWLLKFYAPWCGHCKRLAPVMGEVAEELGDTAKVGKINCDDEGKLCRDHGVKGYPTLVVKKGELQRKYEGSRSASRIVDYMRGLARDPVQRFSEHDLQARLDRNKLVHVLFAESAPEWFAAQATAFQGLVEFAVCAQCDSFQVAAGSVAAFRDGEVFTLPASEGQAKFADFVRAHRFELLPEMTRNTFGELNSHQRFLAVGVVDPAHDSTDGAKGLLRAASKVRSHEFTFAWLDATTLDKFVAQYKVEGALPSLVVLDNGGEDGWFVLRGPALSADAIAEFLDAVRDGSAPNEGRTRMKDIEKAFRPYAQVLASFVEDRPYVSVALLVVFVMAFVGFLVLCDDPLPPAAPRPVAPEGSQGEGEGEGNAEQEEPGKKKSPGKKEAGEGKGASEGKKDK